MKTGIFRLSIICLSAQILRFLRISKVAFSHGLGNQMFQYAFYLTLTKLHPHTVFLMQYILPEHNGFELDNAFNLPVHSKRLMDSALLKFFPKRAFTQFIEEDLYKYDKKYIDDQKCPLNYRGYWQSELYFMQIKKHIPELFRFNEKKLNPDTRILAKELKTKRNTYSIHIRRGDYLNINRFHTYGMEYYQKAFNVLKDKSCVSGGGYVFSDDIQFARANLPCDEGLTFVDWNVGADSWQDMYLMSLCNHNIIANSSFSWWGAYLNRSTDKIVIAPRKWVDYEDDIYNTLDIIPESWIRI